MQLEIEEVSPTHQSVHVSIPVNVVDSQFSKAYAEISKRVALPGFRHGRVPMSLLRKRYGRQAAVDVGQNLLEIGWRGLLDKGIEPVGEPVIDSGSVRPGKPFNFTIEVDVIPSFTLRPFTDLEAEVVEWVASDEVVEHELGHLAERMATWEIVGDRDLAEDGDQVVFDYSGRLGDERFEGGTAEDAELVLGSGQFIPGFEEQIIGKKVGEEFIVEVTFPEDYNAEDLAGQVAHFDCTLKAIKTKVVPPIDEALAEKVGLEDLATVRAQIRSMLIEQHSEETSRVSREAIRDQIVAQYDFPIPDCLIDRDLEKARDEASQRSDEEEVDEAAVQKAIATAVEEARSKATDEVRSELVLNKIAESESITVSAREISVFLDQMAHSMGSYGYQIRDLYQDSNRLVGLRRRMRHDKVLDFLLTRATVTTVSRDVPEHVHDHDHDHEEGTAE